MRDGDARDVVFFRRIEQSGLELEKAKTGHEEMTSTAAEWTSKEAKACPLFT